MRQADRRRRQKSHGRWCLLLYRLDADRMWLSMILADSNRWSQNLAEGKATAQCKERIVGDLDGSVVASANLLRDLE